MKHRWALSLVLALSFGSSAAMAKVRIEKKVIRRTGNLRTMKMTLVVIRTSGGKRQIIFQWKLPRKIRMARRFPLDRGRSKPRQLSIQARDRRRSAARDWAYRNSGLEPRPSDFYGNGKRLRR